jgi:phospholipid/cholesterol/gamma-HCH transport system substrate-binding protein
VLDSATTASADISRVAGALDPVAADLRQAAPELNEALNQMPATTAGLRPALPRLQDALDSAPDTLTRVPDFGEQARGVFPTAVDALRELNPMARYLKPYGPELAQLLPNFGAAINHYGEDGGSYLYVRPSVTPYTVRSNPVKLPQFLQGKNPYTAPGGLVDPRPFTGTYPRVQRDN